MERLEELTGWVKEFGDEAARRYGVDETIQTVREDLTRAQRNVEALEKKCLGLKIVE